MQNQIEGPEQVQGGILVRRPCAGNYLQIVRGGAQVTLNERNTGDNAQPFPKFRGFIAGEEG